MEVSVTVTDRNTSNKKEYIRQMTIWLRRQEAIHCFGQYLQWAVPGYVVGGTSLNDSTLLGHDDDDLEGSEDGDAVDNMPADGSQKNSSRIYKDGSNPSALSVQAVSHRVSKRPGLTGVSIASLAAEFGVVDFLTHLNHFIQLSPLVTSPTLAAGDTLFSLYTHIAINTRDRNRPCQRHCSFCEADSAGNYNMRYQEGRACSV